MGLMGKYIDSRTDEQKDRIITAQRWGSVSIYGADGRRCLVGHAEGGYSYGDSNKFRAPFRPRVLNYGAYLWGDTPYYRFDRAVNRFGLDRVVRACKLRAAKNNRVPTENGTAPKMHNTATPEPVAT